ncbi:MAG: PAS domain-containing protein, partial [Opitutia bacterium]
MPLNSPADSADLFALHDVLGDALLVLDTDGRVVAANVTGDGLLAAWGARTGSELASAPGATAALSDWVRRTVAGGPQLTLRVSEPLAHKVWECALVRWKDDEQWLLRAHEITDLAVRHDEAETALQNFRLLTAQMRDMLFLVRIEGPGRYVCEAVNPAYLAATGMREDEIVGRRLDEVLAPAEAAFAVQRYAQAIASSDPITYRDEVASHSGRLIVETRLSVRRDADGRPTHLVGLARNITEVEHTAVALAASEARLRGVLDAGFDAFALARAVRADDGRIVDFILIDVNERACVMVQRGRDEIIGRSLLDIFPRSRDWGLWEQCCMVVITNQPLETTQFAPTLEEPARWLQRQLVPVNQDAVAISSRDITQRQLERLALEASEARHRQLFETNGAIQLLAEFD